jgi:hypothetical protein
MASISSRCGSFFQISDSEKKELDPPFEERLKGEGLFNDAPKGANK